MKPARPARLPREPPGRIKPWKKKELPDRQLLLFSSGG